MNTKKALLIGINSKYIHPAMGIFQLYTNSKYPVDYKEFTIKDDIKKIVDYINTFDSNYIFLSVYIWNITTIKELIPQIIDKIIILGGPEASYNLSLLSYNVKYIIKGEGEESFNELMAYFNEHVEISEVSNLYYYENNKINYTYSKLPNLNNIKHDLSLIENYENRICYLESSRGCYYNCSYCLASTEKPVRFFPLDEVKENILFLLKNNAKIVKFLDRSFNVNKVYTKEILNFIKDNDNNYTTFQFEIVGDNLDEEIINLINSLRRKMIRFEIGIQTTNPIVTKAIRRKQNFEVLKENILKIKNNVVIHTDLIAGLPFETFESFKKSFNDTFLLFTEELQLGFLKELKGTYISQTKSEHNYIFSSNSPYEVISNNYISKEELNEIKYVEIGVDRLYNRGEFPRLMNYLFNVLKLNPFELFNRLIKDMTKEHQISYYQFHELTNLLYKCLIKYVSDSDELFFIIKKDYLTRVSIKPKIFWEYSISREERKLIYELVSKRYDIDINELYNHAHLEKYSNIYYIYDYKTKREYELTNDFI